MGFLFGQESPFLVCFTRVEGLTNDAGFIAAISALLCALMIVFCTRHWKKECSGLRKTASAFVVGVEVVAMHYRILAIWFWNVIPIQISKG